jgi:hypothetical protein
VSNGPAHCAGIHLHDSVCWRITRRPAGYLRWGGGPDSLPSAGGAVYWVTDVKWRIGGWRAERLLDGACEADRACV